ncbi:MAG: Jag N-terminal domain-containing protein, partial [Desulfomonilaceae bacterium]
MNYVEFTGKTVKDAIAKACDELNVDEALLEVDVLEESARGFLGLVGHRN